MSAQTPTTISDRLVVPQSLRTSKLYGKVGLKMRRKTVRRRVLRVGLIAANALVLAVILFVVLQHPSDTQAVQPSTVNSASTANAVSNPLDQLSSANIAMTVARMSSLPETTAVTNQAESQAADLAINAAGGNVIAKPQVVATSLKSRADIQTYTTQSGDSVSSLASKFGVTSDSIRWSNGLKVDTLNAGTKLSIPPINGIVYSVVAGDTPDSLANKFKANKDQIVAFNDAEIAGLKPGEQILIPNGSQAVVATASSIAKAVTGTVAWGASPIYGYNGYDYGYCTWYVATQVAVPANWGNASSWAFYARASGWNVSSTPTVGAVAQTPYAAGGQGHVAIVTDVSDDGTSVKIRDMNGVAGWGRVGYSDWLPTSKYPNYISH